VVVVVVASGVAAAVDFAPSVLASTAALAATVSTGVQQMVPLAPHEKPPICSMHAVGSTHTPPDATHAPFIPESTNAEPPSSLFLGARHDVMSKMESESQRMLPRRSNHVEKSHKRRAFRCHARPVSKAFTKDDSSDAPPVIPARAPLPPGTPNYVTARGLASLRTELAGLRLDRSHLEAHAEDEGAPRELATATARLEELEDRVARAELVESTPASSDGRQTVRFGATVTAKNEEDEERTFQIVGVDEADAARGLVAFVAPLARAVLGKRVGDAVSLRTPRGVEELEVVGISYG